ncbi:MAG: hypothetical protein ACOYYI_01340 [Chloroflexota bacterium]
MSRDKTIVPTGMTDWPRYKALDSVQRLVYHQLWTSREMMSIGVGLVSHAKLADGASQAITAIPGILDFISQKRLIEYDPSTGEVFVVDWFRFHTFRGVGLKIALKELERIESKAIRRAVLKAIMANKNCGIDLEKNDLNKKEIDEKADFPEKSGTCSANTNTNNNINTNTPARSAVTTPEGVGECVNQKNKVEPPFPGDLIDTWNAIISKVPKSRRPTLKKLVASVRLSNVQPLSPRDWEALFEKLALADDQVAFLKGVQKRGGWDPRALADLARPGETYQQLRQRISSREGQTPPLAAPPASASPTPPPPPRHEKRGEHEKNRARQALHGIHDALKGRALSKGAVA